MGTYSWSSAMPKFFLGEAENLDKLLKQPLGPRGTRCLIKSICLFEKMQSAWGTSEMVLFLTAHECTHISEGMGGGGHLCHDAEVWHNHLVERASEMFPKMQAKLSVVFQKQFPDGSFLWNLWNLQSMWSGYRKCKCSFLLIIDDSGLASPS